MGAGAFSAPGAEGGSFQLPVGGGQISGQERVEVSFGRTLRSYFIS